MSRIAGLATRLAGSLLLEEIAENLPAIIADLLASVRLEDVIEAVHSDRNIVEEYWEKLDDSKKRLVLEFVSRNPAVLKYLDPAKIIEELVKADRTDIASLFLNDPVAYKWLKRQIETVRRLILGQPTQV